ncbi:7,8-didemethyl-8-hydroxy-5-deazariboflavin synthase subunit CofG [Gloeocapsa sp. PCC 73106]|uniref:7,8-didemethyl-8-hydroxy-5-deazariboflavin synthase subunit CofG n=1 Tax=Gloeocapsa sp. PCC 73106 TaxID=102232 RepID=UPI0002ACD96F|nr:7,8-didemethyl-8-hydroxy-5-deazariboflavin synthase subunit CofG [Gloeocapsa sp. PCC 73106]ELS00193.1 FO synthase subunit 1 [Gloeocapsa sp. PCC 73106]
MSDRVITYSPAYTLVPTYECFNRCSYCNFRVDPGTTPWLTLKQAKEELEGLENQNITEILILAGEVHPQGAQREAWFDLIYDLGELALSLGFFPHTNVGPLSFPEMKQLKQVNFSMGLMLEQLTPKLLQTVHKQAPSKVPELRLQQLAWAGELQIPFTTGLLLGIGETPTERIETLEAIAHIQSRWGHLQEVILQPHSPGKKQSFAAGAFSERELIDLIKIARQILPETITIQVPPNLVPNIEFLLACLEAGARDLGGIGPIDEVNPDFEHLHPDKLSQILAGLGWDLVPRLPIYPQYYDWVSDRLKRAIA